MKKDKWLILRLGALKDANLFIMYLANKITLEEAEKIQVDRAKRLKETLEIKGNNLF